MNKTYKIQLPRNKEAYNIKTNIKNGTIEVSVELNEKWEPRDGDMCFVESVDGYKSAFIFKSGAYRTSYYVSEYCICPGICDVVVSDYDIKVLRPATKSEKQLLFDALANEGKMWDAERKQVVDLPRWRAENGEEYFDVIISPNNIRIYKFCKNADCYSFIRNYNIKDNRFKTKEAAERVAEQIREIFKNSKAE